MAFGKKRKTQVAIEYMMIIGIVLLITVPAVFLFYQHSEKNQHSEKTACATRAKQADNFLQSVLKTAEIAYYGGPPIRLTVKSRLPSGIENLTIERSNNASLLKIAFRGCTEGSSVVSRPIDNIPVYGFLDSDDLSEGVKKVVVEATSRTSGGKDLVIVRRDLPVARVFVSKYDLYPPANLTVADRKCTEWADAAGLGGEWKAWRSTSTEDARDRIADATYVRIDGLPIAVDKEDLTDGAILNYLDINEFGSLITSPFRLSTGTLSNGTHSGHSCQDWTSDDSTIDHTTGFFVRRHTRALNQWTKEPNLIFKCHRRSKVYCFEDVNSGGGGS